MSYHHLSKEEVLDAYNVSQGKGLSSEQVKEHLDRYGSNTFVEKKQEGLLAMIIGELLQFLNLLLIVAAVVSIVASGEVIDGIFILAIVTLNIFLSVYQERKASNAVRALKSISAPSATVLRDGKFVSIPSTDVVAGDIVKVEEGDYIPADMRLLESINLKIDESALTGESVPVEKDADASLNDKISLGDRINMAYMSTIVTYGRATGVIVSTGMATEMGSIAGMLNEVEDELTPLQVRIDKLGKFLGMISVIVVILIFIVGFIRGEDLLELFMVSVSLAVAAIPEGLPAVITVVLALGMRQMAKQNAIVKKLSAVETLGSTTVISSDKTGTLTQNKMVVTRIFDNDKIIEVTGSGYELSGEIKGKSDSIDYLTTVALLCNNASIEGKETLGDPTELSLIALASKAGKIQEEMIKTHKRIDEYPFDSDRKMMSTMHEVDGKNMLYTKGASDQLLKQCTHYLYQGEVKKIDKKFKDTVELANQGMARKALRVLGFAYKEVTSYDNIFDEEQNLIFTGLVGIIDPPREEVKAAIKICHKAGIRTVMITGDHKITATAIGKELGIISKDSQAISGEEIERLNDEEFLGKVKDTNVFARVSPKHKVRIVKALQELGEIASMTGDGVNDAPALKQADIGVAMGITGTDVSKEAADMVLMDDNFTTIVKAVEQGRVIYANIRKFVAYLISCNVGEVLVIFIAIMLGFGTPLLPLQILWINLVTDSFPAFALGLEEKEEGIMDRKPIDPNASIVDKNMAIAIAFQAFFLAAAVLTSYLIGRSINPLDTTAQTFAFITIITGELLRSISARSEVKTIFKMNPFTNKYINLSVLIGFALLLIVLFVPGVNDIFRTNVHLTFGHFIGAFALGFIPLFGGELAKLFKTVKEA
jgi:Ca2+-transporting ATPase